MPEKVDLTKMPQLYHDGIVPLEKYNGQLVFLETQRGCKYKCKYCVYHGNMKGINFYPLPDVLEEIDYLLKQVQVTSIRIIDADFVSNIDRAKTIMKHFISLKQQGHAIKKIMLEFNYYDCDKEFLSLLACMKKQEKISRFESLTIHDSLAYDSPELLDPYTVVSGIGIQSLHNDTLKAVARKPIDQQEIDDFFASCREYNLALKLDMILGLPLETYESYLNGLNRMVDYVEGTDHVLQLALLQVLPGSLLEESAGEYEMIYSSKAPYYVSQNSTMSKKEMQECTKLTGLLFRIINSPLRPVFFNCLRSHVFPGGAMELIEKIQNQLKTVLKDSKCKFICAQSIDDDYWCGQIFRDLPADLICNMIADFN